MKKIIERLQRDYLSFKDNFLALVSNVIKADFATLFSVAFFGFLLLSQFLLSKEITLIAVFVFSIILTVFKWKKIKKNIRALYVFVPLLILISIACFSSSLSFDGDFRTFLRGLYYYGYSLIFIYFGFVVTSLLSAKSFLKIISFAAFIISIINVCIIVARMPLKWANLRLTAMVGYEIITLGIIAVLILFSKTKNVFYLFLLFPLIADSGLMFSRTQILVLVVVGICIIFVALPLKKAFIILSIGVGLLVSAFLIILMIPNDFTREFSTKILSVFLEINPFVDYSKISASEIMTKWRGYEVYCSFWSFFSFNIFEKFFGAGIGTSIPILSSAPLNGAVYISLPVLHNAFFTVLYQSGLIGFACLCWYFILLFKQVFNGTKTIHDGLGLGLVSFLLIHSIFDQGVIGASINPFVCIMVGFLLLDKEKHLSVTKPVVGFVELAI